MIDIPMTNAVIGIISKTNKNIHNHIKSPPVFEHKNSTQSANFD